MTSNTQKYQDPNIAYQDVNEMLKKAYTCNESSTEEEVERFFTMAQQAHFIAQTYLHMNTNFEAAALTGCVRIHLYLINFTKTALLPEYEYASDRIQDAVDLATNSDTKLWAQEIKNLCITQMEAFKTVTQNEEVAEEARKGEPKTQLQQTESAPTPRPDSEKVLSPKERIKNV